MNDTPNLSAVVSDLTSTVATISPAAGLVLLGIKEAIKLEPAIAAVLGELFSNGIPSEDDWAASLARIATPFSALAPNAAAKLAAADAAAASPSAPTVPPGTPAPAGATTPAAPEPQAAPAPAPAPTVAQAQPAALTLVAPATAGVHLLSHADPAPETPEPAQ